MERYMVKRLTDEQVIELRERFEGGVLQGDLAAEYGIAQNTVSSIVTGRTRARAGGPIKVGSKRKLTSDDAIAIRSALSDGILADVICERYGITQQMVWLIHTGRAYSDVPGPILRPARRAEPLSVEQVIDIKRRAETGEDRREIAAAYGISKWTVYAVMSGRVPGRGSDSARKRTGAQVREIRRSYAQGVTQQDIADQFGLTQQAVSQIVRGAMYPSQGGPIAGDRRRRLTTEEVASIRSAFDAGSSLTELADRHHVEPTVIKRVVTGVTYPNRPGPTYEVD